jgi:hypothetical protein
MTSPNHKQAPVFRLTKAKSKALELLADYFCLRVKDVSLLMGKDPTDDNDRRNVQTSLSLLYKQGITSRLPYFDVAMDLPTRSYVYGLSDRGAKDYGGKTFDEHSERTLDHELEISTFHMILNMVFPELTITWKQSNIKHGINPDAYFSITDKALPEGKNTFHYFLEIERAKIGNIKNGEPSIVRKLAKYYDYYDSNECQKDWGFRTFRVITVVRTADKQYNLCDRLKDYKHRMFWITTELLVRGNMRGEIFKTPRDFRTTAYSFLSH